MGGGRRAVVGLVVFLAVIAVGGIVLFGRGDEATYAEVTRGRIEQAIETTGALEAAEEVVVRGGAAGLVEVVAVRPGDLVAAGDIVATLDRRPFAAAVEAARAALEAAELAEAVARDTAGSATPVPAGDALLAAGQAERARLELERAEDALRAATVLAPIAGTVLEVPIAAGAPYAAGAPVAVVAGDGYEIRAELDQADVPAIGVGTTVRAIPDAFPAAELTGTVVEVAPRGESAGGAVTFAIRVALDDRGETVPVRAGMTATLVIPSVAVADALLVPVEAIETVGRRSFVRVRRAGEDVSVEVTLGLRQGGLVQVAAGDLRAGERVRVAG